MDEQLKEYRSHLIAAEQKAQEDFDKTVLSLSGGALGISFAFVKDIVGPGPITNGRYLFAAWICWGVSVTLILTSYFTSHLALRHAIKQVDTKEIYTKRPGGHFDLITASCNALGAILFFVGAVLMIVFVSFNLEI
jgi:hypothetical protein